MRRGNHGIAKIPADVGARIGLPGTVFTFTTARERFPGAGRILKELAIAPVQNRQLTRIGTNGDRCAGGSLRARHYFFPVDARRGGRACRPA